jgi:glycosyltransferase involved in cell wall biosynthesis
MSALYEADSCSINGKRQIQAVQYLFRGKQLPNCHRLSCGADARFALTLPAYETEDYMVTISRLEPNKKVMLIARALSFLDTKKLPKWVVVGFGSDQQQKELTNFCKVNDINMELRPCFGAEKWVLLKKAVVVLCGWTGIVPSEAILCDVPVISFDHHDIVEMYDDTLHWVVNNNTQEYAHKVDRVLSMRKYYKAAKRYGRGKLLNGELYAVTQEQSARQYEEAWKLAELGPMEGK